MSAQERPWTAGDLSVETYPLNDLHLGIHRDGERLCVATIWREVEDHEALAHLFAAAPEGFELVVKLGNALIDALPGGHPDFALVAEARKWIASARGDGEGE